MSKKMAGLMRRQYSRNYGIDFNQHMLEKVPLSLVGVSFADTLDQQPHLLGRYSWKCLHGMNKKVKDIALCLKDDESAFG